MPEPELEEIYNRLSSNIVSDLGQCVLLLGPELSVDKEGNYYKSYFKQLANDKKSLITNYFSSENLFAFKDDYAQDVITNKIKDFYTNVGDKILLEMISRIQFPLIINVCPDKALNNIYDEKAIKYSSGFFSKLSKPLFNHLSYPSKQHPIIYNIFGSIDNDFSLVLTHGKMYETIEHLLPEKSLPDNIEYFLSNASSFIFLGFKFDSWYYQLICHKLGLVKVNPKKTSLSVPSYEENVDTVSIVMSGYFNMNFTKENPAQTIEKLIEQCETRRPGSLRPKVKANQYCSVFISYARNDEHEDLIELIKFTVQNTQSSEAEKLNNLVNILNKAHINADSEDELLELINMNNENIDPNVDQWYENYLIKHRGYNFDKIYQEYKREDIVDLLESKLKEKGGNFIQVFRDRKELTYGDSIDSFMNRIGKGKTVIRVISDKYLKSRYCMDEALRIKKYQDIDKRIFTIVLPDAELGPEQSIIYKKYWEVLVENIYGKIDSALKNRIDKERIKKNYHIYLDVYDYMDEFIKSVQDEVHLKTNSYHANMLPRPGSPKQEEFDKFIETIISKMKEY